MRYTVPKHQRRPGTPKNRPNRRRRKAIMRGQNVAAIADRLNTANASFTVSNVRMYDV